MNPKRVYLRLAERFGYQNWWPVDGEYHLKEGSNPFDEIIIGAILTQNTSWRNVERSLERLKKVKKLSLVQVLKTPLKELENLIKPSGFYRQKARYLKEVASFLLSLNGAIPGRENLLKVRGVGRETADVILLYAYNVPTFVIDKYTLRWLERFYGLRLKYEEAKSFFENSLAKNVEVFKEFHALLDELAKRYCSTKPKCEGCPLKERCLRFVKTR